VARHLGVAVPTLRSWNLRYGLGPTAHEPGRHRRYSAADVERLQLMCRLVAKGVTAASAAEWVLEHPDHEPDGRDGTSEAAPGAGPAAEPHPDARAVAGLVAAAMRLDSDGIGTAVAGHIERLGVVAAWERVCLPAVTEIGARTEPGGECMDAEFVLSWTLTAALHRVQRVHAVAGARTALLACTARERHTLGLDALRAALAEHGIPVRALGAATPADVVVRAARRTDPGAVVLWSQDGRTAQVSALERLVAEVPDTVPVAAGPGWRDRRLPRPVIRVESLRTAKLLVVGASSDPATGIAVPRGAGRTASGAPG
jgi:MerR family transcriptional regulator, light-induced transcriptional regulator